MNILRRALIIPAVPLLMAEFFIGILLASVALFLAAIVVAPGWIVTGRSRLTADTAFAIFGFPMSLAASVATWIIDGRWEWETL